MTDGQEIGMPLPSLDEDEPRPLAFCTSDEHCKADVDGHDEGCPVEARLREEFGY